MREERMKKALLEFPEQFANGEKIAGKIKIRQNKPEKVLVCGMGGSALPGDFLKPFSKAPVIIHRNYGIPFKPDKKTLVFVISYSGNTEETISAFKEVKNSGAEVIAISSNGKLERLAKEYKIKFAKLPPKIPPRCATGYMFSIMYNILKRKKAAEKINLKKCGAFLKKKQKKLIEMGRNIAKRVKGRIPIVYSDEEKYMVARTVKIKFNENAKTQSFFNVFPELNHNEMIGFTNAVAKYTFLIFENGKEQKRIKKRINIFEKLFRKKYRVVRIKLEGGNLCEQIFYGAHAGDWASYYLALSYGVDPFPVPLVEKFKKEMRK